VELADFGMPEWKIEEFMPDEEQEGQSAEQARQTLAERFVVPPFSVLDARQGYWQDRKRAWVALGIESELGRGENSAPGGSPLDAANYDGQRGDGRGRTLGAIAPNENGENGILTSPGKYAARKRGGVKMALETSKTVQRLKPSADQALKRARKRNDKA